MIKRKTISLNENTFNKLIQLKKPEDTYDSLISRLIDRYTINENELDRVSWYIEKLIISIQTLKVYVEDIKDKNKVFNQLQRVNNVLNQISERLGINVDNVISSVKKYVDNPNVDNTISLNESVKEIVKQLIKKLIQV